MHRVVHGSFRDECLNPNGFLPVEDVRAKLEDRRQEYNEFRPQSSLGEKTPEQFLGSGNWAPESRLRPEANVSIGPVS
ncbi:MAG TPA: transposase [Myxococcales bacterium]|nr:transposase [Myxococcales bacterium]HIK84231.1 transposase [Myxococcales bacterium]